MTLDLKSFNPISEVFTPSISICPVSASTILSSARIIDDFPAPVLPTMPIFSPSFIYILRFFRTKGNPDRYLNEKLFKEISPFSGHLKLKFLTTLLVAYDLSGVILQNISRYQLTNYLVKFKHLSKETSRDANKFITYIIPIKFPSILKQ